VKFLKNIQFNYYQKLLDTLYQENKLPELKEILLELRKKDKQLFYHFAIKYLPEMIHNFNFENLFNKKIIWLNSFYKKDIKVLTSFLDFYLNSNFSSSFSILDYSDLISEISNDYDLFTDQKLTFEEYVRNNLFFQFLITEREEDYIFLINNSAFFEQREIKNYFTFTNLCLSYVYIINNPILIFSDYVSNHKMDKDQAITEICNLHQNSNFKLVGQNEIIEPSQSWNINVQSWTGNNVLNTFNGHILKKDAIFSNGLDVFSEIIAHLNQAGISIDLNYEKIAEFVDYDKVLEKTDTNPEVFSNKIKKIFHRECYDMAKKFDYDF
tara:strand:- start:1080 stop:2054 length:975 start_codon:yes stop_codon:yes gene_type:complete